MLRSQQHYWKNTDKTMALQWIEHLMVVVLFAVCLHNRFLGAKINFLGDKTAPSKALIIQK